MRRTGLCTCLLWLLLVGPASLGAQAKIPPPRYLTDEEQIRILLHRLREGIKCQDLLLITDGFASEIETDDSTFVTLAQAQESLQAAFANAEARREDPRFKALTPPGANLTSTWDFGMEIDTVRFLDARTAVAETRIYFGAAEPDTTAGWQFGRKRRETIRFQKISGEWRVNRVNNLISLIR